jgi:hypothetical protein
MLLEIPEKMLTDSGRPVGWGRARGFVLCERVDATDFEWHKPEVWRDKHDVNLIHQFGRRFFEDSLDLQVFG